MSNHSRTLAWVKHSAGLDGAVAFTLMARIINIASSVGTVLLIVHFMSPIEQGYYYTLLGLAGLQIVFELGFSFVILQLAAHEAAQLTIHHDGRIEGDSHAHARLASVLQLTVRWYLRAAVALAAFLLPLGILFFSRRGESVQVDWFGPWVVASLAISISFLTTPLYSFLEGCNNVREVAKVRMYQGIATLTMSWTAVASGHGLYAPALVNIGVIGVGAVFLFSRRNLLVSLLRYPPGADRVPWRAEVWPFQCKIAVTWMCSYFTLQVFAPILFAFRGPRDAGKMGLSLSITGYIPIVALSWVATKAAPFGQLVKRGHLRELNRLFFRTLKQSFCLTLLMAAGCFAAVLAIQRVSPRIAQRMESPQVFVLLLLAAVASFVVQALAVYLRSFKREPYMVQSTVVALLTLGGVTLAAQRWGNWAVAVAYSLFSGVLAVVWALLIFSNQWRRQKETLSDSEIALSIGVTEMTTPDAAIWHRGAK